MIWIRRAPCRADIGGCSSCARLRARPSVAQRSRVISVWFQYTQKSKTQEPDTAKEEEAKAVRWMEADRGRGVGNMSTGAMFADMSQVAALHHGVAKVCTSWVMDASQGRASQDLVVAKRELSRSDTGSLHKVHLAYASLSSGVYARSALRSARLRAAWLCRTHLCGRPL